MRILIINYEFPPLGGGAGNASYYLAKHFAGMGHDVAVLTSSFRGFPKKEFIHGFHVFRVPVLRRRLDRCSVFEMLTFIGSALFHSGIVVKEFRPEKTIAFFGIPSGPVALWMKYHFQIPYMLSLRGGDVPGFLSERLRFYHCVTRPLSRLIWRHADGIAANSHRLKSLAHRFFPGAKIVVIPNGVDTALYRPGPRAEEDQKEGIRLLTVGRLSYQKGMGYLIEALSRLKAGDMNNGYSLEIVGDGPLRKPLEKLARDLGIREHVIFSGWISKEDMPYKYQSADIFILPSLDEGLPNVILEAMASKLPVITTTVLMEEGLIEDGENGFMIPVREAGILGNRIETLSRNKQLKKDMGNRNLRLVSHRYNWRDTASKYGNALQSL